MLGINLSNVEANGSYQRPGGGAYVCQIVNISNNVAKKRIEIEFDIYEGDYAGYYKATKEQFGFWGGNYSAYYTDRAQGRFKAFIEAVIASNANTDGLVIGDYEDIDETKLVGKLIGLAMGEKEYLGNDGLTKRKLDTYGANFYTVEDIRNGNYKIPEFKPLESKPCAVDMSAGVVDLSANFGPVKEDDIPF